MTDIRFYHLERRSLFDVLPALLTKALSNGHRIVVKTIDDQHAQRLNEHLWTFNPNSFLPHGTDKDGAAEDQPVYLTSKDENPNNADVLILTGGTKSNDIDNFKLCCEMLDGNDRDAVQTAREQWKLYQAAGHNITYWQQSQNGWEKKAG